MYLKAGFGVPSDAITVSVYWSYAASLKPTGIALGLAAVVLAIAGWLRHYHQWVHARGMVRIGVPLMSLFVIGISLTAGLVGAEAAANRARVAAASGENPAAYYGVQGRLVCVKPVSKGIPVFNGPLANRRSLLTFGTSGDRVWLWDPRRDQSLSVRLEDVVVTEAGASTCGARRRRTMRWRARGACPPRNFIRSESQKALVKARTFSKAAWRTYGGSVVAVRAASR